MYRPLIAPRILAVHPAVNDFGETLTWVELSTAVPGGGCASIDLLIGVAAEKITASIARAAAGALIAVVAPMSQTNERTGRQWHCGSIGPASEVDLPPMAPLSDNDDEMDSALVAPKVLRVYPGEEANDLIGEQVVGEPVTCLDLLVGDKPGTSVHFAVGMRPYEVKNALSAARALGKPLVFWHPRPLPFNHKRTGKLIVFGHIERLSARASRR